MTDQTPLNELIIIEPKDARALFTTDDPINAMAPILGKVRAAIDAWMPPDVTTAAGRKEIASFAHKITKSKTYLEGIGKELAAEAKKIPGLIDATRRHNVRTLEAWAEEARKPLTDWEADEETRIDGHKAALAFLVSCAIPRADIGTDIIRQIIAKVEATDPSSGEEFAGEMEIAKAAAMSALNAALAAREKADADAEELATLRAKVAEQDAKDAADRKAKADAEAEIERRQELREAAERAATEAAAKAKADQEAKEAAEAEAQRKREANTSHRRKVNREAVADLVSKASMTETAAIALVTMIAKGEIANVTVNY